MATIEMADDVVSATQIPASYIQQPVLWFEAMLNKVIKLQLADPFPIAAVIGRTDGAIRIARREIVDVHPKQIFLISGTQTETLGIDVATEIDAESVRRTQCAPYFVK
jgi:hypothetical protein